MTCSWTAFVRLYCRALHVLLVAATLAVGVAWVWSGSAVGCASKSSGTWHAEFWLYDHKVMVRRCVGSYQPMLLQWWSAPAAWTDAQVRNLPLAFASTDEWERDWHWASREIDVSRRSGGGGRGGGGGASAFGAAGDPARNHPGDGGVSCQTFVFPVWAGLVAAGGLWVRAGLSWYRHTLRARWRNARGLCANCGYDLRGTSDAERCPECGHVPTQAAARTPTGS
jgi:hypothetical protein